MRELEQKQKLKRRIYSIPALIGLFLITVALSRGAYSILTKERLTSKEVELLQEEVADLSEREAFLNSSIEKLKTEEGIEEEIKSKFNVARSGERVAVIVDPIALEATTTPEKKIWYKRLWSAIIGGNE